MRGERVALENERARREADRAPGGARRRPAIGSVARRAAPALVGREAAEKMRIGRLRGAGEAGGRFGLRCVERPENEENEQAKTGETAEQEGRLAVAGPP